VQGTWRLQQLRHVRARREPVPAPQEQGGRKIQRAAGSPTAAAPRRNSSSARGGEQRGTRCGRYSCSAQKRLWASMRRPCLCRRPRWGQRHVPPPLGRARARTGTGRGGAAACAVRGGEAFSGKGPRAGTGERKGAGVRKRGETERARERERRESERERERERRDRQTDRHREREHGLFKRCAPPPTHT